MWPNLIKSALLLLLLCLALSACNKNLPPEDLAKAEQQTTEYAVAIQMALERCGMDMNNEYPQDLGVLAREAYLPLFPENPFKKGARMQPLKPGEKPSAGNFTYIPLGQGYKSSGTCERYILVCYGLQKGKVMPALADAEALKGVDTSTALVILHSGLNNIGK
jgi:hypothetical protein